MGGKGSGRTKDLISSKRGKERLRAQADRLVTQTIRLLDELNRIAEESGKAEDIRAALNSHIDILPFIKPKLQAIAPAQLDAEGDLTPQVATQIAQLVQEEEANLRLKIREEERLKLKQGDNSH